MHPLFPKRKTIQDPIPLGCNQQTNNSKDLHSLEKNFGKQKSHKGLTVTFIGWANHIQNPSRIQTTVAAYFGCSEMIFPRRLADLGRAFYRIVGTKNSYFFSKDPSQEREHHLSLGANFFQSTPKFWGEPIHSPWKIRQWPVPEINITLKQVVISRV